MATKFKRALVWFRRDLRLSDHPALHQACRDAEEVVPLHVLSDWKGSHPWTGPARQKFLCGSLESLARNLESIGGRLVIRCGRAPEVIEALVREAGIDAVYFNRDVDPFGRRTEAEVARRVEALGAAAATFKDAVLHEHEEILTNTGNPYRVYTPYSRSWLAADKPEPVAKPRRMTTPPAKEIASLDLPTLDHWDLADDGTEIVEPGERAARRRMCGALDRTIPSYAEDRDTPAGATTSRLSQDLRFGLISIRELFQRTRNLAAEASSSSVRASAETFMRELAWREFYMQILAHFPEVLETEFHPDWRGLPWDDDADRFDRWRRGETGFPIVDAGMRQLRQTGFMHNRVRMITAMFLTKDLHLHWMLGEGHFMRHLVDGEIASNNGGWQWSAGTGADAAPYFRIQNPWSQTKSHDPNGHYIREWVPELRDVDPKRFLAPPESGSLARGYPAPMVDHAAERQRTLEMFKRHKEGRS